MNKKFLSVSATIFLLMTGPVFAQSSETDNGQTTTEELDKQATEMSQTLSDKLASDSLSNQEAVTPEEPAGLENYNAIGASLNYLSVTAGDYKVKLDGYEVFYRRNLNEYFSVNLSYNTAKFSADAEDVKPFRTIEADIIFDAPLLSFDWRPFQGVFKITTGVYFGQMKIDLAGDVMPNVSETFGANDYTFVEGDAVDVEAEFKSNPIKLGFAWEFPIDPVFIGIEVNVAFHGDSKVTKFDLIGPTASTILQSDIDIEIEELNDKLKLLGFLPTLKMGVGLSF